MIHKKIISFLEEKYPVRFSEKWDKTSLQVGSLQDETEGILFALDPSIELVDYAVKNSYNLLITHHPLTLSSLFPLNLDTYIGRLIKKLILNNITLYAMHTNFDSVEPTVSDLILEKMNLKFKRKEFLSPTRDEAVGFGRIIDLETPMEINSILSIIKKNFSLNHLRFIGNSAKMVSCIAVMGGSGASFIEKAYKKGVELYITGDIKYHDARLAEQLEIEVADIGHFHSELYSTDIIKKLIDKQFDIKIETFKGEKDPFILWR